MKYLKIFNETATGGLSYGGESGNVYSMPTSMSSTLGPNSIANNVGSADMNQTLPNDIQPLEEADPIIKKRYKSKKKKVNIKEQTKKKPIMAIPIAATASP